MLIPQKLYKNISIMHSEMKIVIIGLGAAGFAAAMAAKKTNKDVEIAIIDKKDYDLGHPCGIPFYLEGKIKEIKDLNHDLNLENMNIKKYSDSDVISIDTENKEVLFNLDNEDKKENYDKLIITTGASPVMLPIEGVENAYKALDVEDVSKIKKDIKKIKEAVIIGAGAIGLETAVALKENNVNVSVVDIMGTVLPNLIDSDISGVLEDYLKEEGINLLLGKKIKKIEKDKVILEDGIIKTDITVLAAGVKSNIELVKDTKIKTEKGIIVNNRMETNIKDVYAAGDCTQQVSLINKKPFNSQLATTACTQGTVAGVNVAGGDVKYEGVLGTFVSKVGSLEIAATGFNSSYAEKNNYEVVVGKAKAPLKPEWFSESSKLTVKIIADKKNGNIIGGQAVGEEGAASRINIIATAIKAGFTFKKLTALELAYCPAVSDVKDVLVMAAEIGLRRVDRK